jgi:hypothetical protein
MQKTAKEDAGIWGEGEGESEVIQNRQSKITNPKSPIQNLKKSMKTLKIEA